MINEGYSRIAGSTGFLFDVSIIVIYEVKYRNTICFICSTLMLLIAGTVHGQDTMHINLQQIHRPCDTGVVRTVAPQILSVYRGRAVDTQLVVETFTDTVLVTLIDNGTIDGDTVTLVVNGHVAYSSIGLSDRLRYFRIGMVKGQRNQIIMYAENLGQMPPNTALMRIYHSGKTELIYASSDYNKSFGLILQHRNLFIPPFMSVIPDKRKGQNAAPLFTFTSF